MEQTKTQLGTFSGVFVPSFLTIMGVIIFLRMGFVMGNTGLWHGLLIIVMANSISILTSLSVSAIATNTNVKGGGVYYLISRSLGLEFGGPIGLVLFLSQAVSVAFYLIGFAEILSSMLPILKPATVPIEIVFCVLLFISACLNLDWAAKIQIWILVFLVAGLVAFLVGSLGKFDPALLQLNSEPAYIQRETFWTMFAIFFPAITGFTQGISLSGDLKKPERSIPIGTLFAVGLSFVIYVAFGILVLGSHSREGLLNDYLVMKKIAWLPMLIDVGVICATLSSALTSFLGAPRILQAIARDNVFPFIKFFAHGSGPSQTPRRATLLTFIVALICIFQGDLNTIAPIVTMFFLLTYGLMNYATFVEDFGNNPSFRPRFRFFHWRLSLAGAIGCVMFMLFINTLAAIIALIFVFSIYWIVEKTVRETSWGDAKRGFYFSKIKDYLLRLRTEPRHAKNWRPQMLVLSGNPKGRLALVKIGLWLEAGRGILTLANIITGTIKDRMTFRNNELELLRDFVQNQNLPVFWEVMVAPSFINGVESLVQCNSINGIKPNTILLGWSEQKEKKENFIEVIQSLERLKKNIVIIDEEHNLIREDTAGLKDIRLDIWWRGEKNGGLMLLLAYLWTQNPECHQGKIRLLRMVDSEEAKVQNEKHLTELVESSRIEAEVQVFVSKKPFVEIVPEYSKNANVVFFGLSVPEDQKEEDFLNTYEPLLNRLSTTVLVHSVKKLDVRL